MKFDRLPAVLISVAVFVLSSCASQQVGSRPQGAFAHWKPGRVSIQYPPAARQAGVEGFVVVGYTILPDGSVAEPFHVRSATHGGPAGVNFRGLLIREALSAISRRTYTPRSENFQHLEIGAASVLKFQMRPITPDKDPCRRPKSARVFDRSEIHIKFGAIAFDKWGNPLLMREITRVPLVPLHKNSLTLYGVHIDNPECHSFSLSNRIYPTKNSWYRNRGKHFERLDESSGASMFESPFQEINSRSNVSLLVLQTGDLPGTREIEIRVNDEPFTLIQFEVVE